MLKTSNLYYWLKKEADATPIVPAPVTPLGLPSIAPLSNNAVTNMLAGNNKNTGSKPVTFPNPRFNTTPAATQGVTA
jgi:hypothetical protein